MKTVSQILSEVRQHKDCRRTAIYTYFKRLGIKPLGARQRPQLYPDESSDKIIKHLFGTRIVSMRELQAIKAKAQAARRGK